MGGLLAEILEEWRELERRLAAAEGDETKAIKARIVRVRVELALGFQGTPVVTRVVLCNGGGDYERGRYAVYRSDGT